MCNYLVKIIDYYIFSSEIFPYTPVLNDIHDENTTPSEWTPGLNYGLVIWVFSIYCKIISEEEVTSFIDKIFKKIWNKKTVNNEC